MAAYLSPVFGAGAQLFTNQGIILAGGKIYSYIAGTTTPQATWTDSTQAVANANPIILDSAGRTPNEVWLQAGVAYKLILTDSNNNTLGTWDNISGVNDVVLSAATVSEWVITNLTPSYISSTSFSVPGNNTATFQPNRRVQIAVTAGIIYGYVETSTFGAGITTVVVQVDSTVIDSGISSVNVGLLDSVHPSYPQQLLAMNSPVSVASAATTLIGKALSANVIVTGTVTITAFDAEIAGIIKLVRFDGVLTLTHNATTLILPGGANITTAAGDQAIFRSLGSGNWECTEYQIKALAPGNVNFATNATNATNVVGSGTISATTTGGAALTPTNATNATNVVGSGTISATTTGGGALTPTNATNATNATNVVGSGTISATTTGGAALTPTNATNATTAATVSTTIASGATGTTQAGQDNSTKISTTAYVDQQHDSQTFTANGTWTKPAWVMPNMVVEIECWGGGGGGGHSITGGEGGGGGGGGSYSCRRVLASSLGATEPVTVGAAGAAGTVDNGGAGSASSFGSTVITAAGGFGGVGGGAVSSPAAGGAASSNNGVVVSLWDGAAGGATNVAGVNAIFGGGGGGGGKLSGATAGGGVSVYGGSGGNGSSTTNTPAAGTAPSGGGGGGDTHNANGAAGARGEVRVRIF